MDGLLTDADLIAIEAQMAACADQPHNDCPCHNSAVALLAEVQRLRALPTTPASICDCGHLERRHMQRWGSCQEYYCSCATYRAARDAAPQPPADIAFLAYPPGGARCRVCGRHVDVLGAVHPECERARD